MSRVSGILLSLLIIFLLTVFFIMPKYQEFDQVNFELKEKKAELEFIKDYYEKVAEQLEIIRNNPESFAKVSSAVPEDPFLPSLFNFIATTASESGLVLTDIEKFGTTTQKDRKDLKETSMTVTLNGQYSSLKSFLSNIEQSSRMIEVENIVFEFPRNEQNSILLDFHLTLKAYSY